MIEINYLDVNEWLVKIEIDQKLTKIEDWKVKSFGPNYCKLQR